MRHVKWLYTALFVFLTCGVVFAMQDDATNGAEEGSKIDWLKQLGGTLGAGVVAALLGWFKAKDFNWKKFNIKKAGERAAFGVFVGAIAWWQQIPLQGAEAWLLAGAVGMAFQEFWKMIWRRLLEPVTVNIGAKMVKKANEPPAK